MKLPLKREILKLINAVALLSVFVGFKQVVLTQSAGSEVFTVSIYF